MLLALALAAHAGPYTDVSLPEALQGQGLVLAVVPKAGVCTEDPWPLAEDWLGRHNATAVLLKPGRDTDVLKEVVGEGPYLPPMALAWHDGAELDRVCGCLSPEELAGWLGGLVCRKSSTGSTNPRPNR